MYALNFFLPQVAFLSNLFITTFLTLYLIDKSGFLDDKRKIVLFLICLCFLAIYSYKGALNFLFMAGIPAFAVFLHLKNRLNKLEPVIFGPLPAFLLTLLILLFFDDTKGAFLEYVRRNIDTVISTMEKSGGEDLSGRMGYLKNNKDMLAITVLYLIPSVSYVYISFMTLIAQKIATIKMMVVPQLFKVPFHMVWLLILGGFTFLSDRLEVKVISYNTFIIFTYLYFIQGSNLITYILMKKRLLWLRIILLLLILLHPYVILAIAFIGLFDNWFNFATLPENDSKD
ncbi:MAG: YybS family protein [Calditerrivibrio sp.]|nr:YybS family protein [Calditerrivibrio sp.]